MSKYIMKCGHADNATLELPDGTKAPACAICGCIEIVKEITDPTECLEGRKAICNQHKGSGNGETHSNWNLPFFEYRPKCDTDTYYCGCRGWN